MQEEHIDLSDDPESTPEQFARAALRKGLKTVNRK